MKHNWDGQWIESETNTESIKPCDMAIQDLEERSQGICTSNLDQFLENIVVLFINYQQLDG